MEYLYLALNMGSLSIPLWYSWWEKEWHFIQYWRPLLFSTICIAIPFLIWDAWFTSMGVWGFNPMYHLSIDILGLPLEECLFFFCIPYASIFTHYALRYYRPNWEVSDGVALVAGSVVLVMSLGLALRYSPRYYTFYNYMVLAIVMAWTLRYHRQLLRSFLPSFLVILFPFFIVNGVLTGSFIPEQVVWYNNEHNLGVRMFTIPVEDAGYAFSMLFPNVVLFEYFKRRVKN